MKILMVCDHYPVSPRVKKVRDSLLKLNPKSEVRVLVWNRKNLNIVEDYVESFNQEIGYGNKLSKLLNLFAFHKKIKIVIKDFEPTYIHSIDLEMFLASKSASKNQKIIYEVYDIKAFNNKLLNWVREVIEKKMIKKYASGVILASPYFSDYYQKIGAMNDSVIVVNNKPSFNRDLDKDSKYMNEYKEMLEGKMVIGFVGTLRYRDILVNLIKSINIREDIALLLCGSGPDYDYLFKFVMKIGLGNRVVFTERYETKDLKSIYNFCDYIWAAYPNNDLNVKYAISNKYFESILFNKKIIVSSGTMLGAEVLKQDSGYIVNPHKIQEIEDLIKKLKKTKYKEEEIISKHNIFWESEEFELLKIYK